MQYTVKIAFLIPLMRFMKTTFALIIAVLVGVAVGFAVGKMRHASSPAEAPPKVEAEAQKEKSASDGGAKPRVEVDQLDYDFGTLDMEGKGQREFTVTNRGNAILELTRGATSCRCTISELERTELPPGESTKIVLRWRPDDNPGPYEQSASFLTNDPERPSFSIVIRGKITTTLRVQPPTLTFSRISGRETSKGTFAVLNYFDRPLTLSDAHFEEGSIQSFFDSSIAPLSEGDIKRYPEAKNGYLVTVFVKPGLPQGPFKQTITLSTDNPDRKALTIPIEGSVGTEISVVGPDWDSEHDVLQLGVVKSDQGAEQKLLLVVRGPYRKETKFKIKDNVPAPLTATLGEPVEIGDGQVLQTPLTIRIPQGSLQVDFLGDVRGNDQGSAAKNAVIELATTHPDTPTLRLQVRCAVEK
jgi:hypothetical protein